MDFSQFLITILAAWLGSAGATYIYSKRIKAIERTNSLQLKLIEDVYNAHKSLWEDIRMFKILGSWETTEKTQEGNIIINRTEFINFLYTLDTASSTVINFRDRLSGYSLFLEQDILKDAEYIQYYLDVFLTGVRNGCYKFDKNLTKEEWLNYISECSITYTKDLLPKIFEIKYKIENYLRKNIFEHDWSDITPYQRSINDAQKITEFQKTVLYKINHPDISLSKE